MVRVGSVCAGRLFWVWGLYALVMVWLSDVMTAAGLQTETVWAAGLALGALLTVKSGLL